LLKTKSRTVRFKENDFLPNLNWDATNGEFKVNRSEHFVQNQEDEDEMNDYASYRNLDPDYVEYLKELRRAKRLGQRTPVVPPTKASASSAVKEIPVTPNIGLTSITNTNVLVNDTLERMKYSLNKINTQLTEKKGQTFEGTLFTE
jgi:hypothetical protein